MRQSHHPAYGNMQDERKLYINENKSDNIFCIYQLKSGVELLSIRFESLDHLFEMGVPVLASNYQRVYVARLEAGVTFRKYLCSF